MKSLKALTAIVLVGLSAAAMLSCETETAAPNGTATTALGREVPKDPTKASEPPTPSAAKQPPHRPGRRKHQRLRPPQPPLQP